MEGHSLTIRKRRLGKWSIVWPKHFLSPPRVVETHFELPVSGVPLLFVAQNSTSNPIYYYGSCKYVYPVAQALVRVGVATLLPSLRLSLSLVRSHNFLFLFPSPTLAINHKVKA
jgi:hypothetical protein